MRAATERFVGRQPELLQLQQWLDDAVAGRGRVAVVVGEPGIGKTRLAQELAGAALAAGRAVAWGRCGADDAAPAFWPWHQVVRSLGEDPDVALGGLGPAPEGADRYARLLAAGDLLARVAADRGGVLVVVDDLHWADPASRLLLHHVAAGIAATKLLVVATTRRSALDAELVRLPGTERIELRGLPVEEVAELLGPSPVEAAAVHDVTGGNPLFVREVGRAAAEGRWSPEHPPATVLDVVTARLGDLSPTCRRFVQAAAVAGRAFRVPAVAAALGQQPASCAGLVDEAVAHGLLEREGAVERRFVHALVRDAVASSLAEVDRIRLHRALAEAIGGADPDGPVAVEHVAEAARHWLACAPYGDGAAAMRWAARAADDAMRRLAFEDAARLLRAALDADSTVAAGPRAALLARLSRATWLAGDQATATAVASDAADLARAAGEPELAAAAAVAIDAVPDPAVSAVARRLCEQALEALGPDGDAGWRARLLAQQSHLDFYDGRQDLVVARSAEALALARASGQDAAITAAVHARKEALPGPVGRRERTVLADELLALAQRSGDARSAMWGALWRTEALLEAGELALARESLGPLGDAARRVGGPAAGWLLDRTTAAVAQGEARFDDALGAARRALERMQAVEPLPARGAHFALRCAVGLHRRDEPEVVEELRRPFDPPPRFATLQLLSRAAVLARAGLEDEAAAWYQRAGAPASWALPAFFVLPGLVFGAHAAIALGRTDDVLALHERLAPFRAEHASAEGVSYLGPVALHLGRLALALGRFDEGIADLEVAVAAADRSGAPGFAAEARLLLAGALVVRRSAGDAVRAAGLVAEAQPLVAALGLTALEERAAALARELRRRGPAGELTARELDVAELVADGLTNRQIADRLVISERTAQNHVQHILTKLGYSSRSQIATWVVGRRMGT